MSYLYLPPDLNVLAGRTVTSITGTPDSDHELSWLTDQRTAFPIRYPAGAWKVSVSVASGAVSLVALANTSIDDDVTVGGTATGTITPGAIGKDLIRKNPYVLLGTTVENVTTLTLEGTNIEDMVLGEAFAGVPREMPAFKMSDVTQEYRNSGTSPEGEWMNIPMHGYGTVSRVWRGSQIFTRTQRDEIIDWWDAQMEMSLPGVLIIDEDVNDCRAVMLGPPEETQGDSPDLFNLTLTFFEFPGTDGAHNGCTS